ncbi:hypothetical protein KM043_010250 [Ampulex compressa]|nr:hypothetical protein KM043_010250 [Ampulex compressa]
MRRNSSVGYLAEQFRFMAARRIVKEGGKKAPTEISTRSIDAWRQEERGRIPGLKESEPRSPSRKFFLHSYKRRGDSGKAGEDIKQGGKRLLRWQLPKEGC